MHPVYFTQTHRPWMNAVVCEFVSHEVWGTLGGIDPNAACSMGVFDDAGSLVAGSVYHFWEPEAGVIQITSASKTKRWLTRKVVRHMFALPFDMMDCQLIALRVSDRNEGMIAIARRFGFSEVHIPRLRGRDEGEWIFTLTSEAWRSSKYCEAT